MDEFLEVLGFGGFTRALLTKAGQEQEILHGEQGTLRIVTNDLRYYFTTHSIQRLSRTHSLSQSLSLPRSHSLTLTHSHSLALTLTLRLLLKCHYSPCPMFAHIQSLTRTRASPHSHALIRFDLCANHSGGAQRSSCRCVGRQSKRTMVITAPKCADTRASKGGTLSSRNVSQLKRNLSPSASDHSAPMDACA